MDSCVPRNLYAKILEFVRLKIMQGKPRHSQSQGSAQRANIDIEDVLRTCLQLHDNSLG